MPTPVSATDDLDLAVGSLRADADATRVGEADGVVEQVEQHLADARAVHQQLRQVVLARPPEGDGGAAQQATRRGGGLVDERAERASAPA